MIEVGMAVAGVSTARSKTSIALRRSSSSTVAEVADEVVVSDSPTRALNEVVKKALKHERTWGLRTSVLQQGRDQSPE
jgi:hypothetical protein